ncbi:1-(5-phosphoribosyl)-5-[(5-phosphoribosylamino)methylideneamino] imidazole-4-carboxamide isomerase [Abditibacterium utsteinense]|uniref:1-(5-phosphoribosyl)-5-[(5-phosphoribosylamino)methylideneamino] imidazole-4-carboxamide isomerase n=1 Tax=Abditibacterium utsteinense TaxID=1960156 RepID=A0A2S8SUC3_9BACT|nr:1-(5-phosphoribosyl)-5-[(5-phosphoribosylamino)methylideneamino]imidazole-4-carboxamide isomerase [Abditibacterium utsteinense]PQV64407.1 1-(5-phosphoribosyl)-5-[(5-phosphoribosylamino)methylideneamino] imidazole-4-carboxamide isomerase [Abditibacterium utsteinense]
MKFEIIPAIDIRGGKCVRLIQGDYNQETVYGDDPLEMAKRWAGEGATRIHIVDLDGAKGGVSSNLEVIQKIAGELKIPVQVGGGIRNFEALDALLDAGVQRGILGTQAAKDPHFAEEAFAIYADAVILGIDARDGKIAVEGWQETSNVSAVQFAKYMVEAGCMRIIFTDIARDGMLTGPNLEALREMAKAVEIPIIASGGVKSSLDVAPLREIEGIEGLITGKAIYENRATLREFLSATA